MKGKDLCYRFFAEVGLPAIQTALPECVSILAVGIPGGSQAHGNDDEVSHDHGWGPGFHVWLTDDHFTQYGEALQSILDTLPREYLGYGWQDKRPRTCSVGTIEGYVRSLTGYANPPTDPYEWLHIPEESLFEATPDRVFYDATGETSRRFAAFGDYPADVWKQRLAACLSWLAEWGFKHLPRAEQRGDVVTAAVYWAKFAVYAMKVAFLLNHRYSPYHKWRYREFLKLPHRANIDPLLRQGFVAESKSALAAQIMSACQVELRALGYQPTELGGKEPVNRVAAYYGEIHDHIFELRNAIELPRIRELGRFVEVLEPCSTTIIRDLG